MTDWTKVQGSQDSEPAAWDTTTSSHIVYQRRNIKQVETKNPDGSTAKLWEYEERQLTPAEYQEEHANEIKNALEQGTAQIAYIAMMSDVNLPIAETTNAEKGGESDEQVVHKN